VQDQVARLATPSQGVRQITGPLTEGPGPTSSPGSLPAPRVACHRSPVGFDRQQFTEMNLMHPVLLNLDQMQKHNLSLNCYEMQINLYGKDVNYQNFLS
jgi:hypothetical protein